MMPQLRLSWQTSDLILKVTIISWNVEIILVKITQRKIIRKTWSWRRWQQKIILSVIYQLFSSWTRLNVWPFTIEGHSERSTAPYRCSLERILKAPKNNSDFCFTEIKIKNLIKKEKWNHPLFSEIFHQKLENFANSCHACSLIFFYNNVWT